MQAIQQVLEKILELMGIDNARIEIQENQEETSINISGLSDRDTALLIGRQGENLFALQYLVRTLVRAQSGGEVSLTGVVIDVMSYRQRQVDHLTILAKRKAQEAKMEDREIELRPMNGYERRIIHMALKDDEFIETSSRGEEPDRRVVIKAVRKMVDV